MAIRRIYRIATFVPPDHVDAVVAGVERVIPLRFGPYDSSAWWSSVGTEQYRPLADAKPTVGTPGVVQRVPTVRVEFAIPPDEATLLRVIEEGIRPHHPWEEPAIFVDEAYATATRMIEVDVERALGDSTERPID